MREPDIGSERIAALLDGRLSDEERAELLGRLSTSGEFREFAETAAVLRELEEGAADADAPADPASGTAEPSRPALAAVPRTAPPSAARPRWRRPAPWLGVAAMLALAVLGPLLWRRGPEDLGGPVSRLASRDEGLPPDVMENRAWPTTRGGSAPMVDAGRAVRAGALHTDLLLATRAGDTDDASLLRRQIGALVDDIAGSGPVVQMYEATAPPPDGEGAPLSTAGEALAELAGPDEVRWGAWLEAALIAAKTGDTAFFEDRESRAALARAAKLETLPHPARDGARALEQSLRAGGPRDFAALEADLRQLMRESAS